MKKTYFKISAILVAVTGVSFIATDLSVSKGIDLSNFDQTAKPTDDFFQFVNGNWVKKNPVPDSESKWGSFHEIYERNTILLKKILEEAAANKTAAAGSNSLKIGDFYSLAMDSVKLNKEGVTPLLPEFEAINKITNTTDLIKQLAHLHSRGIFPLFGINVDQDDKVSTQYITLLGQGGLGLPERDYYLKTDDRTLAIQKEYIQHLENMFKLLGDQPERAKKEAKTVFDLETRLAKVSMTQIQLRDPQPQYNKKNMQELAQLTPNFQWDLYLTGVGIKGIQEVIVAQPEFFKEVNSAVKTVPVDDWKTYLRWGLINGTAGKLSDNFVNEHFHFYGTVLYGAPVLRPRWKRALQATDEVLGDALGELFVKKHFPENSKKRVNEMVDNIMTAYKDRIATRDWMSAETKVQANLKLGKIIRKLGYPDKWKDYSSLQIKKDSYVQNILRGNAYNFNEIIGHLGKPIDRSAWFMTAPTINAYYGPKLNEIVFPAGIMQPVFFDPEADDAVNYGSMGAVIGHELTHGFDDQGSKYDADGNLKDWWTKEDLQRFKAKTEKLIKQFDKYVAIDDLHVKGELTVGENIADLGGLTIAYYALKKSLVGKPVPAKIDGFTAEQRFFIAWGQSWRVTMRPEYLKNMLQTDPHSPENIRANAAPSNMPEFYEAFGVKEGDKMYRPKEDRVEIW